MSSLSESELENVGRKAASAWASKKYRSLNEAAAQAIKQAGRLTRDEMERITHYTNRHAYLEQHNKMAGAHRYVQFDTTPARVDEVIKQATGLPEPVFYRSLSDYEKPPEDFRKKASWEELFGVDRFPEPPQPTLDPFLEFNRIGSQLHHSIKQANSDIDLAEMELEGVKHQFVQQMKTAHQEGASLRDLVRALSSVSSDPDMMKAAFQISYDELVKVGHHTPRSYFSSLKTASSVGSVNQDHPLLHSYRALLSTSEKVAAMKLAREDLEKKFASWNNTREALFKEANAASEQAKNWGARAGGYVSKAMDFFKNQGDNLSKHLGDFGAEIGGQGSIAETIGRHSGKLVQYAPHLAAAGLGLRAWNHLQGIRNSKPVSAIASFIPGTDEYERKKYEIMDTYGAVPQYYHGLDMPFLDHLRSARTAFGNQAREFGQLVGKGVEGAAATAMVGGLMMGAQKVYDHLTKARDFKNMLASPFNTDLQQHLDANPEKFNAAFTSLRRVNPALTRDPMVAGAYMRRTMEYDNAGATGVLVEALNQKERMPMSPLMDMVGRGVQMGIQGVYTDRVNRASDARQPGVEEAKLRLRVEGPLAEAMGRDAREMEIFKNNLGIARDREKMDHAEELRLMAQDSRMREEAERERQRDMAAWRDTVETAATLGAMRNPHVVPPVPPLGRNRP